MDLKDKVVFTEKEAAVYIGMSRSFLRNARINGNKPGSPKAPSFFVNGSKAIRYLKTECDKYLDSFT